MSKRFYSTLRTEPDMRQELINTLDGRFPEIAKKMTLVLRKMRRDGNGQGTPCPCIDPVTKEPDKDHHCPICWGEGWLWDESLIDGYKVVIKSEVGNALSQRLHGPGLITGTLVIFYTRYSEPITRDDRIIELILNEDGTPAKPYMRRQLYRIGNAIDLRGDHGRLEYWKLDCYADDRKFLNGTGGV